PGGTSRGVLREKETYFLILEKEGKQGIGECGLFKGLSADDRPDYEAKLQFVCENIGQGHEWLFKQVYDLPSIQFGLEQAFLSLDSEYPFELIPSKFTRGTDAIAINGLIWMGDEPFMKDQIAEKIEAGFTTVKLKIGAIDFDTELGLLKFIRNEFSEKDIELRVDANGAFLPTEALEKLNYLSDYHLHSIEQPIKAGQWQEMAELCEKTPLPIALDEELIGIFNIPDKEKLIKTILPQYIILKPSLIGGFAGSDAWIHLAESNNIGWWITSALESNVGLNAIAQYTYSLNVNRPQGLGTGGLFTNNFDSPLYVIRGKLHYNPKLNWKFNL
ncbi:MAG: o-succinylbenzoate synthase, partial [Flavobacteriaceae bacterium]|nr:o-succinylbenzoate synthase [Flavobacteriaceae bacterium]